MELRLLGIVLLLLMNKETLTNEDPSKKNIPRPVILLLGPTGVGKSSLANTLFGYNISAPAPFPVGHKTESFTREATMKIGNWLGNDEYPKFTLIDTAGTGDTRNKDCQKTLKAVQFLKDQVQTVDVFVLMFKGTNIRFDESMQRQLELFESVFGHEMWENAVTEISFWKHTKESAKRRMKNKQNETLKHTDWNDVYRKKFNVGHTIPTLFIDPLYNSTGQATDEESLQFKKWTDKLWEFTLTNGPYSCSHLCRAPHSFFVGTPFISPEESLMVYQGSTASLKCYMWVSGCHQDYIDSIQWNFNGKRMNKILGQTREIASKKFKKYIVATLEIKDMHRDKMGYYSCFNSIGNSLPVEVNIKMDSIVGQWSDWSTCSKSCVEQYERLGQQSRKRSCWPAINGGLDCSYHGDLTETRSCAGDGLLPTYCPVHATWSLWTHWDDCDASCLQDGQHNPKQRRKRFCREGENSPLSCENIPGLSEEERRCLPILKPCPKNVAFTQWSSWSDCSHACLPHLYNSIGGQSRIRKCEGNVTLCNIYQTKQVKSCNLHRCPEDGHWQQWLSWTPCNVGCGEGKRRRRRFCNEPRYGGQECQGPDKETTQCNLGECEDAVLYKLLVLENKMNDPKLRVPITEDLTFILKMEQAVGYSERTPNGLHWKSPMKRFSFYEDVLNKVHILLHYQPYRNKRSISRRGLEKYNKIVGQSVNKMNKFAKDCDSATKKFGISQVVSGSLAIASGVMVVLGILLAPVTAGLSTGLSIAGTTFGLASGLQGLTATLVEKYGYTNKYLAEFEMESRNALAQTELMQKLLENYSDSFQEAYTFINSTRAEPVFELLKNGFQIGKGSLSLYQAFKKVTSIQTGIRALSAQRNARGIFQGILEWTTLKTYSTNKLGFDMQVALLQKQSLFKDLSTKLIARERTVPQFLVKAVNKIARKEVIPSSGVIIKEGSKLSKGLTGLGGIISIGFGIWDTIHGADKIKHGSKLSDEFRKVTSCLVDSKNKINKFYDVVT